MLGFRVSGLRVLGYLGYLGFRVLKHGPVRVASPFS